jgi:hypothetical protein
MRMNAVYSKHSIWNNCHLKLSRHVRHFLLHSILFTPTMNPWPSNMADLYSWLVHTSTPYCCNASWEGGMGHCVCSMSYMHGLLLGQYETVYLGPRSVRTYGRCAINHSRLVHRRHVRLLLLRTYVFQSAEIRPIIATCRALWVVQNTTPRYRVTPPKYTPANVSNLFSQRHGWFQGIFSVWTQTYTQTFPMSPLKCIPWKQLIIPAENKLLLGLRSFAGVYLRGVTW